MWQETVAKITKRIRGHRTSLAILLALASCDTKTPAFSSELAHTSSQAACMSDADCPSAAVCSFSEQRCRTVLASGCSAVTGDAHAARALRIGLLSDQVELAHSAQLAASALNSQGTLPVLLVVCDASDPLPAAQHLVADLHVAAIIGPNTSEQIFQLTRELTVRTDTLTLSTGSVSAQIGQLFDDDLSWSMLPTEQPTAAVLIEQVAELERQLRAARDRTQLKLGIVVSDDLVGASTLDALSGLQFNDHPLSHPTNLGQLVTSRVYDPTAGDQTSVLEAVLDFAPDLIVLVGDRRAVSDLLAPLEAQWPSSKPAPFYLLTEPAKTSELLGLALTHPDLIPRIRGVATVPSPEAEPVHAAFVTSYQAQFGSGEPDSASSSATYDAVFALAYAARVSGESAVTGSGIARGLRRLTGGAMRASTGSADITAVSAALGAGAPLHVTGTLAALAWDETGLPLGSQLGVWCLVSDADRVRYGDAGVRYAVDSALWFTGVDTCESAGPAASTAQDDPHDLTESAGRSAAGSGEAGAGAMAQAGSVSPAPPDPRFVGLVAQYRNVNADPTDTVIAPSFKIVNGGNQTIALRALELRYYFSNEHNELCPDGCIVDAYWAGVQPSGVKVNARRSYVSTDDASYLSITFDDAARLARGESVELQQQFHLDPYRNLNESDDYSFDAKQTSFADWPRITLYAEGMLVWGEPAP